MQKIVLFTNSMGQGGAERQLSVLAGFLYESGYDVVVSTINDDPDHYDLVKGIKRTKICNVHSSKILKTIKLFRYFLTVSADCIISYGQRENLFMLFPMLFRKRPKLICSERSFTPSKPSSNETILVRFLYRYADYIVPNSRSQSEHLIKTNPSLAPKIFTVINYVDTSRFQFQEAPHNTVRRIGFFCRYEEVKNCINVLKAAASLIDHYHDRFIIEWYGTKTFSTPQLQAYYDHLEQMVRDLNLLEYIHLNDAVKDVQREMEGIDIIALASFYEGFSNSIAEAISCGKPMLVSRVSDNVTMVKDNYNGFLFAPSSLDDMCMCFHNMLALSDDELSQMGRNSRAIAEDLFSKEAFIEAYTKLIEA